MAFVFVARDLNLDACPLPLYDGYLTVWLGIQIICILSFVAQDSL
jgi:hypothetical protein